MIYVPDILFIYVIITSHINLNAKLYMKRVYKFGIDQAEGNGGINDLLGAKK